MELSTDTKVKQGSWGVSVWKHRSPSTRQIWPRWRVVSPSGARGPGFRGSGQHAAGGSFQGTILASRDGGVSAASSDYKRD